MQNKRVDDKKTFNVNNVDKKISRNASCPCGSGKKYKKCCLPKVEINKENSDEESQGIIKEFKFDKKKKALIHPLFLEKSESEETINIYLFTLGHLWIYKLIEDNGYNDYLYNLVEYSIKEKNSLFEWDIEEVEEDIYTILNKYDLKFKKYLNDEFNIFEYKDIIEKSKDKDHAYHRLTRLLVLAKVGMAQMIITEKMDIKEVLNDHGTIINSLYLIAEMNGKNNNKPLITIPDLLLDVIKKNMECRVENTEMKYYPKVDLIIRELSVLEEMFSDDWYLIPENDQVIISKFLYSIRIVKELTPTLLGLNGILSAFVTRTLFDNYWQSMYLIKNEKINDYRQFALDRMRLHILKRGDRKDITSIYELLGEIKGDLLDPIPINGDYFDKSVRVYATELDIKDDYDKYYEYNSEFIHASLTAIYSGITVQCINPEHNKHLTIHPGCSRLINSVPHIFEILNKHIDLINNYFEKNIIEKFNINELFFANREEFFKKIEYMKHI